jgi:hypothetical protein
MEAVCSLWGTNWIFICNVDLISVFKGFRTSRVWTLLRSPIYWASSHFILNKRPVNYMWCIRVLVLRFCVLKFRFFRGGSGVVYSSDFRTKAGTNFSSSKCNATCPVFTLLNLVNLTTFYEQSQLWNSFLGNFLLLTVELLFLAQCLFEVRTKFHTCSKQQVNMVYIVVSMFW